MSVFGVVSLVRIFPYSKRERGRERERSDYLHEASRRLQDQNIYKDVKFNESILTDLVAKNNKTFKRYF